MRLKKLLCLTTIFALACACASSEKKITRNLNTEGFAAGTTVRVYLTNSSMIENASAIEVALSSTEIRAKADENASRDKGWRQVADEKSFDLVQLDEGKSEVIGDAELPAGEYSQVRLKVKSATIVLKDGSRIEAEIPADKSYIILSGIKLDAEEDENYGIIVDFDAQKTLAPVVTEEGSQKWVFKPMAKVKMVGHINDNGGFDSIRQN